MLCHNLYSIILELLLVIVKQDIIALILLCRTIKMNYIKL